MQVIINKEGYIYVYVANESTEQGHYVHFDDLKITYSEGPVVQESNYYPFGLQISSLSWQREDAIKNLYKFTGKEEIADLNLGWIDFGWRMFDPSLGRWNSQDKLASIYFFKSPCSYAFNNPINFYDPNGLFVDNFSSSNVGNWTEDYEETSRKQQNKKRNETLLSGLYTNTKNNEEQTYYNQGNGNYSYTDYATVGTAYTANNGESYAGGYRVFEVEMNINLRVNAQNGGGFNNSEFALGSGGLIYGVGENLIANKRLGYWIGKNGKYYSGFTGRGPNQFTGSRASALKASGVWKIAGRTAFVLGAGLSTYNGYSAYQLGDYAGVGKAGLDLTMGAIATFGDL